MYTSPEIREQLAAALEAFLNDHRTSKAKEGWEVPDPPEPGCGCNDCEYAGKLLGDI